MNRKFIWWLGFVTLFVLFSVTAYGDSWPTYHSSSSDGFKRSGVSPASVDPATLTLDWFFTPGVGNALEPGLPNATGIPVFNGGQSAVIGFGKVYYLYLDTLIQEVLVALDASSGALLWSHIVRGQNLGFAALQPPTVSLRTVDAVTDTVVYIGGTNNSFRCVNANTGALIWNTTGLSGNMRNANQVFDTLVISMDNSALATNRKVTALTVRDGTVAWTSVTLVSRMFVTPSLSNDTVFVNGRSGIGAVTSLDAKTGAVLGTYAAPPLKRYQNGVVVFDDNLIAISRNDESSLSSIQVWKNTHDVSLGPTYERTYGGSILNRFSTPEVYVEPSVGETVVVYGTVGSFFGPGGDILMFKVLPGPGIPTRSLFTAAATIHGPGAVAAGNGLLLQGDDAGIWYALDANSYGAFFGGGLSPFWHKVFPGHITAGAAISPEDDTLVVIMDGNGNVAGWRNGHVTSRPRVQTYHDFNVGTLGVPRTEVVMAIIPTDPVTGNGGSDDTTLYVYENVGADPLTYELDWGSSPIALSAADLGGLGAALSVSRVHPTRERMAKSFADDAAITAGDAFMEKKYDIFNRSLKRSLKNVFDMEEDGVNSFKEIRDLYSKATYFGSSKLQEAKAKMTQTGWLFVNDLNGGGAGAGSPIELRLAAINPDVGFGQFFGEIKLFNTNEPDTQGNALDTTRMPVILVIGFLGERCNILADDTLPSGLTVSNYGRIIGQDGGVGHAWYGNHVGFDGGYELGRTTADFAGLFGNFGTADPAVASASTGWKSDSTCQVGIKTYTEGAVSVEMDTHFTKLAHVAGLPLTVREYGWAFRDPITPHAMDVVYKTFVVTCTSDVGIDSLKLGVWADEDVHNFGANNGGRLDNQDAIWQYDNGVPNELYGVLRVPGDNINVSGTATMFITAHNTDGIGAFPHDPADLVTAFDGSFKGQYGASTQDFSLYNGSAQFSLGPGESKTVTWIWFGADTTGESGNITTDLIRTRAREWLALAGYYRGDVNLDGTVGIADAIYIGNYIFKGGPEPVPFLSQGDVNDDGVVNNLSMDHIYVANYTLFGVWAPNGTAPAPIDRDRFVPDLTPVLGSDVRNVREGLTNDANWEP